MKLLPFLIAILGILTCYAQKNCHPALDQFKNDSIDKYPFILQTASGVVFSNLKNQFLLDRNDQWNELTAENTPFIQVEGSVYTLNLSVYKKHVLVTSFVDIADQPIFGLENGARVVDENGTPIYEDGGYDQESGVWNFETKSWLIEPKNLSVEFTNKQFITKKVVPNPTNKYNFFLTKGDLLIEAGELQEAQNMYDKAHDISPDKYETTDARQLHLDSLQKASLQAEKILQLVKYLGAIEKTALDGNYDKCRQLIDKGKNLFNSPDELVKIESLINDLQTDSSDQKIKNEILELRYTTLILLGDSFASLKAYEKAIKHYTNAKEIIPDREEAYSKIDNCKKSLDLHYDKYNKFLNDHHHYNIEINTYSISGKLLNTETVVGKREVKEHIQSIFE